MDAPRNSTEVYCEYSGLDHEGRLVDRGFGFFLEEGIPWQGPILQSVMRQHRGEMRLVTTASLRVYRNTELLVEEQLQRLFQPAPL